jgi:ketosteroid isomerase-like protein
MHAVIRLFVLGAVGIPLALGQTSDSYVESKILAMEALKCQAYRAKDLLTLDRILDVHFVSVTQNGNTNSKTNVLVMLKEAGSLRLSTEQILVRLHGDTAIATGLYELNGVRQGKAFSERGRFVDTWLSKDGQWKVIASLATRTQ